jgi:sulfur carrier protein
MDILLNDEPRLLAGPVTVLQTNELDVRRVAVELNEEIVPRSQHQVQQLQPGDRAEIVCAIGGG